MIYEGSVFLSGCLRVIHVSDASYQICKVLSQKIFFLFLCIKFSNSGICFAQMYSRLSPSDTVTIKSKIFNSDRKVIVTKTLGIKDGQKDNNCIVYMDADDANINGIILQSANNLMVYGEIPRTYLIGIVHENRNAELLAKDTLLNFIKEEVVPLLRARYNPSEKLAIAGHSFGGYFATYAFFKENVLFNSCIAISPAYWPNKGDVLNMLNQNTGGDQRSFYLAIGDKRWDEISLRKYVLKAKKVLEQKSNLLFSFNDLKGFSHNATPTVGFGLGLSFIYDEWEWTNILIEQERNLKSYPDFWGHTEIMADALFHLKQISRAKALYKEALKNVLKDPNLTAAEAKLVRKRLKYKIKHCK